jgi:hypothetical protein
VNERLKNGRQEACLRQVEKRTETCEEARMEPRQGYE